MSAKLFSSFVFRTTIWFSLLAVPICVIGSTQATAGQATSAQAEPATGPNTSTTADFYVATDGNDSWAGTLAKPFKTVNRAREAVETLKAHVSGRTIRVLIRGGVYYLPSAWTFSASDSGTSKTPILYANYPGETPVISGGKVLTGWTENSEKYWQLTIPSGEYFTQLWVNGARRYRPRTTPFGYLYITGEGSTTGSTTTVNELTYETKEPGGVPATMANLGDVELIDFEAWDVAHMRIASVNTKTDTIVTTQSISKQSMFHGFIPGHRFLLDNVKEALREPGQFYLDRAARVLTYIPEKGETISTSTVVAPNLQTILQAEDLSNVTFQGLVFEHSDYQIPANGYLSGQGDNATPAALSLTNSTGVVFESDTVEHTGAYAIEFQGTGTRGAAPYLAQFRDGLITDTGAGGIRVGQQAVCTGSNPHTDENVPQDIYIGDNLITGGGRVFPVGYAVLVADAHNVLVEHNEISDFYNTGVAVGFDWGYTCNFAHNDVTQYNYIHDLGQGVTSDLGAVYYLTGINSGNEILNNKVVNMEQDPAGYGAWGLYLDAGASSVLVKNNLVYRTTDASLHVNSWNAPPPNPAPAPSQFKNNILAYGVMGVMDRHNDTPFLSIEFQNNIFYYDKGAIQYGYWYCEGKTTCTSYFDFNNNLYYDAALSSGEPADPFFKTPVFPMNGGQQPPKTALTFKQWQAQGEDTQSMFSNPMFVNPKPGVDNFYLESSSPARSIGFEAFDYNEAGRLATATLKAPVNAPAFELQTIPITNF